MAEQMDTPGSNADTSVNGGNKSGAPKDKACPFCQQSFTSSSLGRHLDLYIKEKNPKPADGIHNVEEIRKMRGGITRRQPRNSMSRREGSTPAGTPGVGRPSPGNSDVDMSGNRSPSLRRDGPGGEDGVHYPGKPRFLVNAASWESTGVMNNIPPTLRSGDSARSWNGDGEDRRMEGRSRSVSKQMLAKTTFDQKQKMMDALDNAKAAELALRELLGSLRAAKLRRIEASTIFDFDPLTLDFPSLTLECLPPPPTLHTSSPIATLTSWSISPPSEQQYEALRTFFLNKFQNFRVSCTIATTAPQDDFSYPPTNFFMDTPDPAEVVQRAENDATELENKIADHLRMVFTHWSKLPPNKRAELWALELARNIGRKQEKIQKMKTESELKDQENAHLKMQIGDLSRLQQPREYKMSPPATYPFDRQTMEEIGRSGLKISSIGFSLDDRSQHLDTVIERAVGRWKEVVREARGGGMAAQRLLSGSHDSSSSLVNNTSPNSSNNAVNQNTSAPINGNGTQNHGAGADAGSGSDVDADADADAEMDDDAGFVDMTDATHSQQQQQQQPGGVNRAPEAQMQQQLQQHVGSGHGGGVNSNYRLANGLGSSIHIEGMKGTEKQSCVAGYLRVG